MGDQIDQGETGDRELGGPARHADVCSLGETRDGERCELFDHEANTWVPPDPVTSLHDRARAYNARLRRDSLAFGGVGNAIYSDPPDYNHVVALTGLADSAHFTGIYLAAESLRLAATGSPDARNNVRRLVQTLHLWFRVSGEPGLLVRFAAPSGVASTVKLPDLDVQKRGTFRSVEYEGTAYDYIGAPNYDGYSGVMLGYALAYEALTEEDEDTRELIRRDVVEFVRELMRDRVVSTRIVVNGTPLPETEIAMRFVVLSSSEMRERPAEIVVDLGDPRGYAANGVREFWPDIAAALRQTPLLGWIPPIPRPATAIMLASFFRVALLVTEGVPTYATHNAELTRFYRSNVDDWLRIAAVWDYPEKCGESYYVNFTTMVSMYNLARLEKEPTAISRLRDHVLHERMWPNFAATKNVLFSFIYAAIYREAPAAIPEEAVEQLAGFPPPPRVRHPVNLTTVSRYQPHQPNCANQTDHAHAVDVSERVVSDFLWLHHPWELFDPGNPVQTYPGVDYLIAYWLGRYEGFISDDSPNRYLAWRPE